MSKLATKIGITDMSTKWGLVTVINERGGILRQFMITGVDAELVKTGKLDLPPGCTEEEWKGGRAVLHTKCCFVGQAVINPGDWLMVNYGITQDDHLVHTKIMAVPTEEWSLIDGVIYIEEDVLRDMPLIQERQTNASRV